MGGCAVSPDFHVGRNGGGGASPKRADPGNPRIVPRCISFAAVPLVAEAIIRKNAVILPEQIAVLRRELLRQYLATLQRAGDSACGLRWGGGEGRGIFRGGVTPVRTYSASGPDGEVVGTLVRWGAGPGNVVANPYPRNRSSCCFD
jgi:hypothetical protein